MHSASKAKSEYKTNTKRIPECLVSQWQRQKVRVVDVCLHFQWAVRHTVMTSFVNCHYQIVKWKMRLPRVQLLRVANAIECSLSALYQTSHVTPSWVCVCVCLLVWGAYCIECDLGQNMLRFFTFRNGKAEVNSVYTTAKYPIVSCDKIRQVIYAQLTHFGLLYL